MSDSNPPPEPPDEVSRLPLAPQSPEPDRRQSDRRQLPPISGPPRGLRRGDHSGREIIDAMAGRASLFGFGFQPLIDAIRAAADGYLGDAAALDDEPRAPDEAPDDTFGDRPDDHVSDQPGDPSSDTHRLRDSLQRLLAGDSAVAADSVLVCPSADTAVESALQLARTGQDDERYRTVALVGADHGRTGMCRTASGRPQLHRGFGPMMAGFHHVAAGDIDALRAAVGTHTACVLLSPLDLHNGVKALGEEYLVALRQWCDEQGAWLIFDETRLCFGASGRPFSFAAIADVRADAVAVAGGLFAGLPGGIVIAAQPCGGATTPADRYPLLSELAATTVEHLDEQSLLANAADAAREFAVDLAERIGQLEAVRDLNVLGMTIGIETDIASAKIVRAAAQHGLRLEAAGETAVRLQPPLIVDSADRDELIDRLAASFRSLQHETVDVTVS